ncbi:MAG: glycoside hydrolase family 27 protein [Proteiniphilum sp.]
MKNICIIIAILFFNNFSGLAQNFNEQTPSPPMGWNSWNWFAKKDIDEKVVREVIDAFITEGLLDAGYNYVVIDGGWRDKKLGPNGELIPHPVKFPNGIKTLVDYAHSKGLKFGLHTVPGTHDCGGEPVGGFGNEEIQIKQFVDWGIDFIKLDKCRHSEGWDEELLKTTYLKWSNLIKKNNKDIVLSISAYAYRDWYRENSNMSRTTSDISPKVQHGAYFDSIPSQFKPYKSVMEIADENNQAAKYAGDGFWNDPDMLVTGNQGLTNEEEKVHFALWCIMSAPLMLGNDPRNMSNAEKEIILNKDAIIIARDPTEQGTKIKNENGTEIWAKKLKDGRVAALLLNRSGTNNKTITLYFDEIGKKNRAKVKDIYSKKELGFFRNKISEKVEPHSGLFLLLE